MRPFDPTAIVERRLGAAVLDGLVVAVVALFTWYVFVVSTYDTVDTTATGPASQDCDALDATVRDCEEIDGTIYVTDETASLVVQWLTWVVPIALIHVVMQAKTGATVGKHVLGIRTVTEHGTAPTAWQTLVRTALAVVDLLPWCFPAVGLCLVLTTTGHRRIGDVAAKTFIVSRTHAGKRIAVVGDAVMLGQ